MTRPLTVQDLEYELPPGRIATKPVSPRHSAKMLVVQNGKLEDSTAIELPSFLPSNALLVVNETAVLPARFAAVRKDSGGKIEGLFLEEGDAGWVAMLKSNGKLREGVVLQLADGVELTLVTKHGAEWTCSCNREMPAREILMTQGVTPIPPYIVKARGDKHVDECEDREKYQTVYADVEQNKSVAAPTAGLHFDDTLLQQLRDTGIEQIPITLHVGAGTFKGIETSTIEEHKMHFEQWSISESSLDRLRLAIEEGRPVFAVGTTSVRTLESLPPREDWPEKGGLSGSTDLMISPPYEFSIVDGMLTNFHLPKSTLLTLVAAKIGIETLKEAYAHAIESKYRFYSFGDAMLILP